MASRGTTRDRSDSSIVQQLRSMLSVERRDGGFDATLTVTDDLSVLPDHFRSGPIVPGVCLIQAVLLAAGIAGHRPLRLAVLKQAKFVRAAKPGDAIAIHGAISVTADGNTSVRADLDVGEDRLAQVTLVASAEEEGGGNHA